MGDGETSARSEGRRIRVSAELRDVIDRLADTDEVQAAARGDLRRSWNPYNRTLDVIIPDDPNEEDVLEQEMVLMHGIDEDIHERITALAGKNVPAHQVIAYYLDRWVEEHRDGELEPKAEPDS